jgi:hypothetical protein
MVACLACAGLAGGFLSFLDTVEGKGTGAMELVAIHLKENGAFCSRMLSFEGCSFDVMEATLTPEMEHTYNKVRRGRERTCAGGARDIPRNIVGDRP